MALSPAGVLSGTPTAAGTFTFAITVTDSSSPVQSATANFTLTIAAAAQITITLPQLPSGTLGIAYSQMFNASGGAAPYTWSISSGALPAGLSLSTAGVLSGTPTATGSFTFTVAVSDSSSPALTATASYTVVIAAGPVAITPPSLVPGQVGVTYSQTLVAAGGTAPYSWTVASGSLPAGLTLSTAGVLSGTPTTAGTFTFTATVTDSSSPAQTATTGSLSVTIVPATLAITAPSLPSGQVNVAYNQALAATGGTAPYTWTVQSGTLPAGLTLSTAGVLSGTPTSAGTYTFALTVTDSSSPALTATTGTLTVMISPANLTGTALLQGQYFFKIDKFSDNSPDHVDHEVYVGSMILDGAGNITAGESDYSDDNYNAVNETVNGSYTIGNDGRGTLTLNLASAPQTLVFALAVGAGPQGSVATRARFVETDAATDPLNNGTDYSTGFLQLQDPTAFTSASLTGSSVFGWAGDTYTNDLENSLPQQGGLALIGEITVDGNDNLTPASTADIATNETTDTNVALTGSVAPDTSASGFGTSSKYQSFGRALLNLTSTTYTNGQLPAQSVIYVIDANTSFVISYPADEFEPLYSGYLLRQQPGSFSAASLNGAAIAYGASTAMNSQAAYTGAEALTLYGTSEAFVSRYSADGAGNLNTVTDANIAGSIISAQANTLTYTVAASGRTTFSGAASPILWLSGTNAGFAITQPPASQPMLLTLEPQAVATYSTASLNGALLVGTEDLASYLSILFGGEAQVDGAGHDTATLDFFSDDGLQNFGPNAVPEQGAITIDATGRATLSATYNQVCSPDTTLNSVYYLLSPNNAVGIDVTSGDLAPAILTLEPGPTPAPSGLPPAFVRSKPRAASVHPDC